MNSLITKTVAIPIPISIPIRLYSTPIFNSNDSNKYKICINSKIRSYKNQNQNDIIKGINKKDVSYSSSESSFLYNLTKKNSSYKYMYSGLPINNNYKSKR
tara:strand:- start:80 stop:382 length:303 start_codon:yes stop_codon:yes gene_type:complete